MKTNLNARLALALIASILTFSQALAQVPEPISYQGYLTDDAGQPVDGAVSVTFSLYTVASGGAPLWTDTEVVVPTLGLFTVTLGDGGVPFPADSFSTPLWLGIEVEADGEMSPRNALTSAPYSQRARDTENLGGLAPAAYDQAAEAAAAAADAAAAQASADAASANITTAQVNIAQLQTDLGSADTDISQLQVDLTATRSDVITLEDAIPTLQPLVTGICNPGSAIRQILSTGSVTCELDDGPLWSRFGSDIYYLLGRIGVGTTTPAATVQIDAPAGVDPFRARVQSGTKLRVHSNGSVSVGGNSVGPDNGLNVAGDAQIGAVATNARLSVTDPLWQAALNNDDTGGDDWYFGSSASG